MSEVKARQRLAVAILAIEVRHSPKEGVPNGAARGLGPIDGPGSGGRKKIAALSDSINPRGHRVFLGRWDPDDPPRTFAERVVRIMPISKSILPSGDFRDWPAIEAWAREIGTALRPAVTVG